MDSHPSSSRKIYSDRFIPSRSGSNFALFSISDPAASYSSSSSSSDDGIGDCTSTYASLLRVAMFGPDPATDCNNFRVNPPNRNIFRYRTEKKRPVDSFLPFDFNDSTSRLLRSLVLTPRKFPRSPYKVLDAPALQDDFYLNLLDWSSHNVLAVGLGTCVYLWNARSSKVTKLCDLGTGLSVCSLGWALQETHLAVGTSNGQVQIWDTVRSKKVKTMGGHKFRVGALSWSSTKLSSGGQDGHILHHDIRAPEDFVTKLYGHKSEICGLKWSCDDQQLASGANDNKVFIWNGNSSRPVLKFGEHTAAVKAVAWSPHVHGILASGGGTADRCIRVWNTTTNSLLRCVDTTSQVCNLAWSKNVNEVVSTHGYSQNQIIVWKYPTMSKLTTLNGHARRVLYLAVSPEGQTIVTGAGDETLQFWNIFPPRGSQGGKGEVGMFSMGRTRIR